MEPVRRRVPPTFHLPDLTQVDGIETVVPAPATTGTTVVVDTDDVALARWDVSLTHDGTAWHLVLPEHPGGPSVTPTHHTLHASARTIPAVARHALGRLTGGEPLLRVARLEVRRTGQGLVTDGVLQVHVSDEEVSVHTGRRLTGRFREVVLQHPPDQRRALVDRVEAALVEAGAEARDEAPREVRILGPAAVGAPDLPPVPDTDDADAAWRAALVAGLRDLLVADVHLRLDETGRTAAATLVLLDGVIGLVELLDADPALTTGLTTLRQLVGDVEQQAQRLAVLDGAVAQLEQQADAALDAAVRTLHRHLDDPTHAATVAALRRVAAAPGLDRDEATGPARPSVAERVGKHWAPLVGALTADEPLEPDTLAALGAAAQVAPGKAPRRFARAARAAAAAAREHAGALQVRAWLETAAADLPPREAFRAGHVAGRHAADVAAAQAAWADAVASLSRAKARKWLP